MDSTHFDRLTRSVGAATTRRAALRGLAAGLIGATGIGASLAEIDARRRKRHKKRCGAQYAGCNRPKDCCEGLVCKELKNPSIEAQFKGTCAYKRGCGKKNDYCAKNRDCCRKFRCKGHRCKRRD